MLISLSLKEATACPTPSRYQNGLQSESIPVREWWEISVAVGGLVEGAV
jgi:hypothetical protein